MTAARKLQVSVDLALPLDTVTSTGIVYGGKGMGKTTLLSVLMEECYRCGLRFSALDPMGVLWGIRHDASGKGPGLEVLILGGIHGDIPIEPTGGAVVADLVVDEDVSVVIDISRRPDGSMWSIAERVRFVTDYCKRLYQRQGEKRRPILQLIDEAARFAPQTIRKDDAQVAACMGAVAVLVEEGRNVGIGCWLFTQRSARLNKDVAELAETMVAFRTLGPNSRKAVLAWMGEYVETEQMNEYDKSLREAPRGTALVVSPGWLEHEGFVAFRMRETFDSSATPKHGQRVKKVSGGAKPDLSKYAERMKATIERAKATDPKALQAKVAELQAQVKKLEAAKTPAPKVETKTREVYVLKEGQLKRIEKLVEKVLATGTQLESAAKMLLDVTAPTRPAIAPAPLNPKPIPAAQIQRYTPPPAPASPRVARADVPRAAPAAESTDGSVSPVEQRILNTIAGMAALGVAQPDKATVAALVGYHPNAKSYSNAMGHLRTTGYVEYASGGRVALTDVGRANSQGTIQVSSRAELHEMWFRQLGGVAEKILRPLLEHYPSAVSTDEVAAAAGYHPNAKSFSNTKGRLRTLGLIDYPGPGTMAATDLLFPAVLP